MREENAQPTAAYRAQVRAQILTERLIIQAMARESLATRGDANRTRTAQELHEQYAEAGLHAIYLWLGQDAYDTFLGFLDSAGTDTSPPTE